MTTEEYNIVLIIALAIIVIIIVGKAIKINYDLKKKK